MDLLIYLVYIVGKERVLGVFVILYRMVMRDFYDQRENQLCRYKGLYRDSSREKNIYIEGFEDG